jgi:ComF family protein
MPPICPKCGSHQASGILCSNCRATQTEIDGIRSPFRFDGVTRQAIHQLKYSNLKAISPCLAELLANYLESNPLPGEVLVPVPLHPKRLRERGYNQSKLEDCLIRVKEAKPQVKAANLEERQRNVIDAFSCRNARVSGKQVILIDDVCTSGATLESCAQALKSKGAISVWGLTLAREIQE